MSELVIRDIEIPFGESGKLKDFVTPDFEAVVKFYPKWSSVCAQKKLPLWTFQAYLLEVCKTLEQSKARPGRAQSDWMTRIVEHFGLDTLDKWREEHTQG